MAHWHDISPLVKQSRCCQAPIVKWAHEHDWAGLVLAQQWETHLGSCDALVSILLLVTSPRTRSLSPMTAPVTTRTPTATRHGSRRPPRARGSSPLAGATRLAAAKIAVVPDVFVMPKTETMEARTAVKFNGATSAWFAVA